MFLLTLKPASLVWSRTFQWSYPLPSSTFFEFYGTGSPHFCAYQKPSFSKRRYTAYWDSIIAILEAVLWFIVVWGPTLVSKTKHFPLITKITCAQWQKSWLLVCAASIFVWHDLRDRYIYRKEPVVPGTWYKTKTSESPFTPVSLQGYERIALAKFHLHASAKLSGGIEIWSSRLVGWRRWEREALAHCSFLAYRYVQQFFN